MNKNLMPERLPIKLHLPTKFFDEEARCDYRVTRKQKKVWAVELDLLKTFIEVCTRHGIKYTVFAGTMLGCVRHQGFVPWDDDIDVALMRPEYEKLCKVAAYEFNHPYFFQTALTDKRFFFAYARLRNSETTGVIMDNASMSYNNGIYIDIYVLEGYPSSGLGWKIQDFVLLIMTKCMTLYNQERPRNRSFKEMILRLPRPIVRMISYEKLFTAYNSVLGFFSKKTDRIGMRFWFGNLAQRYWVYKDEMENLVEAKFETLKVSICASADTILKRIYGDYKLFPPRETRGKWHAGQVFFAPGIPYKTFLARSQTANSALSDLQ